MRRLHAQHRRLQGVHPEIAADHWMVIRRIHPVRPQQPHAGCEGVVAGRHKPRVAERAQVLAGIKREAAEDADAAGRPRSVCRADGLRRILDHRDAVAIGDRDDRIEIRGQSEQVDRQNRFRARRDRRRHLIRIEIEGGVVDIDH